MRPENAIELADAVFAMLLELHEVEDLGETREEAAAYESIRARLVSLTEIAGSLAARIGLELPPLATMSVSAALAELVALSMPAGKRGNLRASGISAWVPRGYPGLSAAENLIASRRSR